jgi:hypothetical protein
MCDRCTRRPLSEMEREYFWSDNGVQGVRCMSATCSGRAEGGGMYDEAVYVQPGPKDKRKKNKRKSKVAAGPGGGDHGGSDGNREAQADLDVRWACGCCGDTRIVRELHAVEEEVTQIHAWTCISTRGRKLIRQLTTIYS